MKKAKAKMKKESDSILLEAESLINGDRQGSYGHPLDDYTRTANAFNALTGHHLTAEEAILFMVCVKLSREQHRHKRDNLVDAAGYIGCRHKVITERERRNLSQKVLSCRKRLNN